ncbi:MAG: hypothetical protein HKP58_14815, partial [Desulfatitalea sp.]|nr:hypothetical protein [Desulfatitalea sp.]NNK01679.1 hypothetical protein [Desulfatitalea sp.]
SEALLEMMDADVKHLAVIGEGGGVTGIITNSDILAAQEQSPFFIIQEINGASTMEEIIHVQCRLPRLVRNMIRGGAQSRVITTLISKISDAIVTKLIGFAMDRLGPAPTSFVFMALGSEGRLEQTLKTDQDNAIMFEDVPEALIEQVKVYFLKLGVQVCTWLDEAGYAFCKGNVMAQNPHWCQPVSKWKSFFKTWIRVSTPKDLMEAAIFFDFRGAWGNMNLIDDLRRYLFDALAGWTRFFRDLATGALGFRPPTGIFRKFVLETKGPHRNQLDLKRAMTPVVDFARIYALHHGISETNTQDRLFHLNLKKVFNKVDYNELDLAYNHLMQQRLLCQIHGIENGEPPGNFINPKTLSRFDQTLLKEIFKRIESVQRRMNLDFTGGIR